MDDEIINIGAHEVPTWQFDLYLREGQKYQSLLKEELNLAKTAPLSKSLIRAVHTLSGTSNTIGFNHIAKIGLPLEHFLCEFIDLQKDTVLPEEIFTEVETVAAAIVHMVQCIMDKDVPYTPTQFAIAALENLKDYIEFLRQNTNVPQLHPSTLDNEKDTATLSESYVDTPVVDTPVVDTPVVDTPVVDTPVVDTLESMYLTISTEVPSLLLAASDAVENTPTTQDYLSSEQEAHSLINVLGDLTDFVQGFENAKDIEQSTISPLVSPKKTLNVSDVEKLLNYAIELNGSTDQPDAEIQDIFLEEAEDIFDKIPHLVDQWKTHNDESALNIIKRHLHTLKGSARMAGYYRFGQVVHNTESILEKTIDTSEDRIIAATERILDCLHMEIRYINGDETVSGIAQIDKITSTAEPTNEKVTKRHSDFDLELPSFKKLLEKNVDITDDDAFGNQLRIPSAKVDTLATYLGKSGMAFLRTESSATKISSASTDLSNSMDRLRSLLKEVEVQAESQIRARLDEAQKEGSRFDPLEMDRFTRLQEVTRRTAEAMNDLVNNQSEITKSVSDIQDAIAEQHALSDDMQHNVMSMRTVPLQSLKRRFDRVLKQACRDSNKEINFELQGTLSIDNGVLQKIVVPIEHILRNALAHGIEAPAKRIDLGKSPSGKIVLSAYLKGNDIHLSISDDGNGIHPDKIRAKAAELKLINEHQTLTQEQANNFIFHPGFTTADKVSELSGRGVGMDIVYSSISSMGGRINVFSQPGLGTTFDLVVPSYMAVISMVPVQAGNILYAIPSSLVEDVIIVDAPIITQARKYNTIRVGEQEVLFQSLTNSLQEPLLELSRYNKVMIISDGNKKLAVHVQEIEADRNFVMRPLCKAVAGTPGLLGGTVAGDGTPLLVVNPLYLQYQEYVEVEIVSNGSEKTRSSTVVMVVDDSMTVRRITQKFLVREGFQVLLAKDGLDAIEIIGLKGLPDIILSDIEMPNMDGFEFVKHVRSIISKDVPIIMISSRSIEKYQDYATELGVNCSIGKPYQEPELLKTIEELAGLVYE